LGVNDHNFNIELGIDVYGVAPTEYGLWQVETSEGIETYCAVILTTGVFKNPQLPEPGMVAG